MEKANQTLYPCRVCGYDWGSPVWEEGIPTYDICPSCGVEAGNQDELLADVREYRQTWLKKGAIWHSRRRQVPKDWNPQEQMKNIPPEWF